MLELKSETQNYGINLPTSLNEITPEILGTLTEGVKLPDYYCIVALCFEVKLMDIAINVNSNKEQTVNVIPLLAKIHTDKDHPKYLEVGHKVIIERSSLERGTHLHLASMINSNNVKNYIKNNETLRQRLIKGGDGSVVESNIVSITDSKKDVVKKINDKSPKVYILEFKIIPVNDIHATIAVDHAIIDPFKTKGSSNIILN